MLEQLEFILQAFKFLPVSFFSTIFSTVFDETTFKQLPPLVYLFWLGLFVFIVCISLFQNYRNLLKARTIEDTPTSMIRSAAQGYTELNGTLSPVDDHQPVISPLSLTPCIWYCYKIYRKNRKNNWMMISQGQSLENFILKDPTGSCIVDPTGADIHPNTHETWHGFSANPQGKSKYKIMLLLGFLFGGYQYKESRMEIDSAVYAIGNFSTEKNSAINFLSKTGLSARQPYLISNFTQKQLAKKYRIHSILWLSLFLIFMPYSLWWLSILF